MIRKDELDEAIASCQGQQSPNASTCLKLASYYTIRDHLYGAQPATDSQQYSYDAPRQVTETVVGYLGDSEFAEAVDGMDAQQAWAIIDELMDILQVTHNRLYQGVMRKIKQ